MIITFKAGVDVAAKKEALVAQGGELKHDLGNFFPDSAGTFTYSFPEHQAGKESLFSRTEHFKHRKKKTDPLKENIKTMIRGTGEQHLCRRPRRLER